MANQLFHGRYQIERELGRGGMGVVYRAKDQMLNRTVAIKLLHEDQEQTHSAKFLLHEAQAAARLNHPNIVGLYDAGEDSGRPYIVMEFIEGVSLRQLPLRDVNSAVKIMGQVCSALEHAHQNGIIHRDLKPENILIAGDDQVKLMDFGLARTTDVPVENFQDTIIGTIAYLAPEILQGEPASPQSDLYSLGLIFYEMTTGHHPFNGDNLMAIISQQLYAAVVPPSTYNIAISPQLDAIILKLLNKSPAKRFSSTSELIRLLDRLSSQVEGHGSGSFPTVKTGVLDRIARGRLVGREKEVEELRDLWGKAQAGNSQVALISGEPGIGKTRLVKELEAVAEVSRGIILRGICTSENAAPYAPIIQILETIFSRTDIPEFPSLILSDLITISPLMQTKFPGISPNEALGMLGEQQRLWESFSAAIEIIGQDHPILFVIDDIHWADDATLSVLQHLTRRLRKIRIVIVLTYREIALDLALPLNELLGDLERESSAVRIKLPRLNQEQTGEMIEAMFGWSANNNISTEFTKSMYKETEGNPFFLEEVVKMLLDEGKIYQENGEWRSADLHVLSIPQSVRIAIQGRLNRLQPAVQDVLRTAAYIGREFDFETLHNACSCDERELIEALEIAERSQLINKIPKKTGQPNGSSERYDFAHALIPTTLYETLSGIRQQKLHRRTAQALEIVHTRDYAALAWQWGRAGDIPKAAEYYTKAGYHSREVYAAYDAIRFFTEALFLLEDDDHERFDVLSVRAELYALTGQTNNQIADAKEMLALAQQEEDPKQQIDALLALAGAYHNSPGLARDTAARAIELASQINDTVRLAKAWRIQARKAGEVMDRGLHLASLETAAELFQQSKLLTDSAEALAALASAQYAYGVGQHQISLLQKAAKLSHQAGARRQEALILRRLGAILGDKNDFKNAEQALDKSLQIGRAIGDRLNESHVRVSLGKIYAKSNRTSEAEESFKRAIEISDEVGEVPAMWSSIFSYVWNFYVPDGKLQAATSLLENYLSRSRSRRGERFLVYKLEDTLSVLWVHLGLYEKAIQIRTERLPATRELNSPSAFNADLAFLGRAQAEAGQYTPAFFSASRQNLETSLHRAEQTGQKLEICIYSQVIGRAGLPTKD